GDRQRRLLALCALAPLASQRRQAHGDEAEGQQEDSHGQGLLFRGITVRIASSPALATSTVCRGLTENCAPTRRAAAARHQAPRRWHAAAGNAGRTRRGAAANGS